MPLEFTTEQSEKIKSYRDEQRKARLNRSAKRNRTPGWALSMPVFMLGFLTGIVYMAIMVGK